MTAACSASERAASSRLAPTARLTAAEMAPPIAPPDTVCISITNGNTTAIAANASRPSAPTYAVSAMLTAAADSMATMFGNASDNITGSTGPWVSRSAGEGRAAAGALLMRRCPLDGWVDGLGMRSMADTATRACRRGKCRPRPLAMFVPVATRPAATLACAQRMHRLQASQRVRAPRARGGARGGRGRRRSSHAAWRP